MHLRAPFSWLLVLVLILATAVGCKAPELNAIELVPQDANLIANIQVSKIINDQDLRDAYDEAEKEPGQPQTVEEALNVLFSETGIDLRNFSKVVIFADTTTLEQTGYVGVVVEGTFDENQFIDNIQEKAGEEFTNSDYKGYKLYVDKTEELAFAFLSDRMLLLGTTKAVKDAIDVSKGDRNRVGGIILDTYNQLGEALIKCAFELPEEVRQGLTEELALGETPFSLEPFANIDILGFALNKEAETITIQINPHFLSTDYAHDAKDTLSDAISLSKGMIQIPQIEELLDRIEMSVTDSWMTIALEITISELEMLAQTFQQQ